jgi:membrane protease YdiL (CAAX protease family)
MLFGQLFRRVGLWFLPAAALSPLLFGIGHLYQGNGLLETAGAFLVTLIGGIWFSWSAFEAGNSALGGIEANVYRLLTVAISIWLTLRWTQKQ